MSKILTICVLFFLIVLQVKAESIYKDFIVTDNFIWGLTSTGKIKLFDKITGKPSEKKISNNANIILIFKDKLGNVIIADKSNKIKKWSTQQNSWIVISKYEGEIYGVVYDSKNKGFLIKENGIQDLSTKKVYFSNKSINSQIIYNEKWGKPYCFFIDKNDIVWIGFGYGEWGGNLFAFQTKTKYFLNVTLGSFKIDLYPIKSFFEDSNSVYLSAGLQHFITNGIIVRFDNLNATILFESRSHFNKDKGKSPFESMIEGEYIGPATNNYSNNTIYFYSQNGFFYGDKTKDLSKFENWKLVMKPKLHWETCQPDAIGSPMNVIKLINIGKEKFIFLSQNDGLGYFDGVKILILN